MMTRIINVKQILEAVPVVNKTHLFCRIPVCLVKKVKTSPDYTASLTNWTKVLLGHLTLKKAVQLGFIKENHPVDNDFVKGEVSFYDYF